MERRAISEFVDKILDNDLEDLFSYFRDLNLNEPMIIWDPDPKVLLNEPLNFLMRYWLDLRDGESTPRGKNIDPLDLIPALGHIILLDILDDGWDYYYRLYGTKISETSGMDSTGLRLLETKIPDVMKDFYLMIYRAALIKKRPMYAVNQPPASITVATWHRLVLPLADDDGLITRFLIGLVPAYH